MRERLNPTAPPDNTQTHTALLDCVDVLCEFGRAWRELKARQQQAASLVQRAVTVDEVELGISNPPEDTQEHSKTDS